MDKRQRGSEKKQAERAIKPVDSSREVKAERERPADSVPEDLSSEEASVLETFAKYLMPPQQMLCLSNTEIPATKKALERLVKRGMLEPNSFKGGYSLTVSGFNATQQLRSKRTAEKK